MNFTQRVFVNDNPLVLTTNSAAYTRLHAGANDYLRFTGATLQNFIRAVERLYGGEAAGAIIEDESAAELERQLHTIYQPVEAAGGVVFNEPGELLMIYRRGKWDLPKGKLDDGEDREVCALREVSEETGLKRLVIEGKVCDTFHIYAQDGKQLVKRTTWYRMSGTAADKLTPQKEEKILEARWVAGSELPGLAAQSYEAVREVMRYAGLTF